MLHFYTHKESIPSGITFIDDIEAFFYMSLVGTNASKYDSDICNIVLSTIKVNLGISLLKTYLLGLREHY